MNLGICYFLSNINELLFPGLCPACGGSRVYNSCICARCQKKIYPLPKPFQQKIQEEVQETDNYPVYVGFLFNQTLQKLLHCLKYRNMQKVGWYLGTLLAEQLTINGLAQFDYIIPIPVHQKRLRERGFNQTRLICQGISVRTGIPVLGNIIFKYQYTDSQTRLNKAERVENVKNSFILPDPQIIHQKSLLLVDDVITTGATINECAKTLAKAQPSFLLKTAVATPWF